MALHHRRALPVGFPSLGVDVGCSLFVLGFVFSAVVLVVSSPVCHSDPPLLPRSNGRGPLHFADSVVCWGVQV